MAAQGSYRLVGHSNEAWKVRLVFTAPLSRNQPPADRDFALNPNPCTLPPARFANIYTCESLATVLIFKYLRRWLIQSL